MKKLIIIILILFAIVAVTKNFVAKIVIFTGIRAITGLELNIKSVNIGIFETLIDIKGLEIFNPEGFEERLMADAPEIYADYDIGDLLKKKVHFSEIRLDLKELVVVKNREGELNINSLKVVKKKQSAEAKAGRKRSNLEIGVLQLKIGKVTYKDYSSGRTPKVREYDLNINERYQDIKDIRMLARLILFKALVDTGISNITNFDVASLGEGLGDTLGSALKVTGKTAGKVLETTGDVAKEVTEKAANVIKSILPFGK